ncbi:MAG: PIN/TRAM domain-containing protein [Brevinema sp.]
MKELWQKHRGAVIIVLAVGAVHYIYTNQNPWILIAAFITLCSMMLMERLFYEKRGIFIFSQLGFVLGVLTGRFVWQFILEIFPPDFVTVNLEPYFIATFSYLGFYMPLQSNQKPGGIFQAPYNEDRDTTSATDFKLLDTSVIIDGRISDIVETHFISGVLIVPKFVLNEIQALADSQDSIKRSRARRGLDILNTLREKQQVTLKVISKDYPDVKGVDAKLIVLAKEKRYAILTNDYNLNKVARLEGVVVLNINDLSNAVKPVYLPGEEFDLDVLKEGKEPTQGIGYLADGTMVVVANGTHLIGRKVRVKVTSMLQTSAGRIVFVDES